MLYPTFVYVMLNYIVKEKKNFSNTTLQATLLNLGKLKAISIIYPLVIQIIKEMAIGLNSS